MNWRPIAEAAKDGTEYLLFDPEFRWQIGLYDDLDGIWRTHDDHELSPTYFAELTVPHPTR